MTKREYDQTITAHYKAVAQDHGLSPLSTMADEITREIETEAIKTLVGDVVGELAFARPDEKLKILDVGCGNGFTLSCLAEHFPNHAYFGIEKSDDLRRLAESRFEGNHRVKILGGDIRDRDFAEEIKPDVLICQRVIINLLTQADQKNALQNIIDSVKAVEVGGAGGLLIFIEAFDSGLAYLNAAREEFDLPPIPPAHHNLYLPDQFFDVPQLQPLVARPNGPPVNFLSTHYYVSRVLHPALMPTGKSFKRNSHFVKFFSEALGEGAGDFSPLRLYAFKRQ